MRSLVYGMRRLNENRLRFRIRHGVVRCSHSQDEESSPRTLRSWRMTLLSTWVRVPRGGGCMR